MVPKVKWWELNKEKQVQCERTATPQLPSTGSANEMWQTVATLLDTTRKLLGTTNGGRKIHSKAWWQNTEVQEAVLKKKAAFKIWQQTKQPIDYKTYHEA